MATPKWMGDHAERRRRNRRARRQEERAGDRQPASGSKWWAKGDAIRDEFLVSCKTTTHQQFPLRLLDLLETEGQARRKGKLPAWFVEFAMVAFDPLEGTTEDRSREYVVMRREDFEAFNDQLANRPGPVSQR